MNLNNYRIQVAVFLAFLSWRGLLVSASGGLDTLPGIYWEDLAENNGWPDVVVVVDQNGKGNFRTIKEALDKYARADKGRGFTISNARYKIIVHPGIYRENVNISHNYITLIGSQNGTSQNTVITSNKSPTVNVATDFFVAKDITFENTGGDPVRNKGNARGAALRIRGDNAAFHHVRLLGTKGTILDERGDHYFVNSFIQGSDEIIVGKATSLYQNSIINSVAKGKGVIAVSNRNIRDSPEAFAFLGCNITGTGQLLLSRASGKYSRVVFSNSNFGQVVAPEGWSDGNDAAKQKSVVFGEFNNTGKGADRSKRVRWVNQFTASDASPFINGEFIDAKHWLGIFEAPKK